MARERMNLFPDEAMEPRSQFQGHWLTKGQRQSEMWGWEAYLRDVMFYIACYVN